MIDFLRDSFAIFSIATTGKCCNKTSPPNLNNELAILMIIDNLSGFI